jgi:DNA-binding NarL/FixJ family response regulator
MKILLIDDHAIIRSGLRQICAELNATILEADNGPAALALAAKERPAMAVLDLNLPGISGLELLRHLLDADPALRILIFSMHGEALYASHALRLGAKGYLSKNAPPEELRIALTRVMQGQTYVESEIAQTLAAGMGEQHQDLTERDMEILRLLGEGRSFAQIATALGVSYKTIANTATAIKAKLGVARTADLIRLSVEWSFTGS